MDAVALCIVLLNYLGNIVFFITPDIEFKVCLFTALCICRRSILRRRTCPLSTVPALSVFPPQPASRLHVITAVTAIANTRLNFISIPP